MNCFGDGLDLFNGRGGLRDGCGLFRGSGRLLRSCREDFSSGGVQIRGGFVDLGDHFLQTVQRGIQLLAQNDQQIVGF